MSKQQLKKTILEIVDNQLKSNDPPAAKSAYTRLLDFGYTSIEAKEKIGAVVLEKIYNILKSGAEYDTVEYEQALDEMVQASLDYEDVHELPTEWDDWYELVQEGYGDEADYDFSDDPEKAAESWEKAWKIFQAVFDARDKKCSLREIMEEFDYKYPIEEWLLDFQMALLGSGRAQKRLEVCQMVLELFDWKDEDDSEFRAGVGESLYDLGRTDETKKEEGKKWFENWLEKEPDNLPARKSYCWCVMENEGVEAAYDIIRNKVVGNSCNMYNESLFSMARSLAEKLEQKEDLKWINNQLESFQKSWTKAEEYNDLYDDFLMPVQQPIVKEKNIYPNDPCPCGSGKKYKKCCGRK